MTENGKQEVSSLKKLITKVPIMTNKVDKC